MAVGRIVTCTSVVVVLLFAAQACGGGSDDVQTPTLAVVAPTTTSAQQTPTTSEAISEFTAIYFVDAQHGWLGARAAKGDNGFILATSDGGQTWRKQSYLGIQTISLFEFLDSRIGWAVASPPHASGGNTLFGTTDGGETWRPLANLEDIRKIDFITPDVGRAIVGDGFAGRLIETTDGGVNWAGLSASVGFFSACFVDPQHGWALTKDGVQATLDGGQTWSVSLPNPPYPDASGNGGTVYCNGGDAVWALFSGGVASSNMTYVLYRTLDGGATWVATLKHQVEELNVPDRGPVPDGLSLVDSSAAVFANYCGACGWGEISIQSTIDGGVTWTEPLAIPRDVLASGRLVFLNLDHGWAAGHGPGPLRESGPALLVTADGGRTWTEQQVELSDH